MSSWLEALLIALGIELLILANIGAVIAIGARTVRKQIGGLLVPPRAEKRQAAGTSTLTPWDRDRMRREHPVMPDASEMRP